ncbi:hypothetical protein [Breoghania sp.]|uniref:hypothetical protein n=1 Tax=Breoghania sp. TaxID=2065378 RepID=UPI0029CA1EBB|nr:hypothetical protein [Breoghania sp.]
MDEKPWQSAIDGLDTEIVGVQTMVSGTHCAIAAVALALIDKGLIDTGRLIDIIESLRSNLQALMAGDLGDVEDAELALDSLCAWISGSEFQEGKVLEVLQAQEGVAALQILLRSRKPGKSEPE